ncbi:MAG: Glutamine--fructose-6-phosphate aminotransferase (isomerizing) [Dehalococcoidia bacterium]|nr:Glutamine--fructose-6-phosphate aminotransferase (isomerizing) [Chloroflexota bacterium]
MCGIIAYAGYKECQPILLESLKRLEYRGYDSCGIAVRVESRKSRRGRINPTPTIEVYKDVGRVGDLAKSFPQIQGLKGGGRGTPVDGQDARPTRLQTPGSGLGIAHTRWATHGEVSKSNAHPHLDCSGRIAVVHNGVIENFQSLRDELTREGHHFSSETDTEVIPHLIERYYDGDLEGAVTRALADVRGTYAIIVLAAGHKKLVAARRESPLIIGIGDRENFVASDVAAVLDYTDRVIYLEDGDIALVSEGSISITSRESGRGTPDSRLQTLDYRPVQREEQVIPWSLEEAQKGGYEHFMLKEIHEQPKAIENTLSGHISLIERTVSLNVRKEAGLEDIVLVACGTSSHAALIAEYVIGKLCHLPVRVKVASEFNCHEMALEKTWVWGISQSGETLDTLRAIKKARTLGCATLAITNVPGSSITRIAEQVFYTRAGPEIGVAATKTFLTQLVALYLLAFSFASPDIMNAEGLIEGLRLLPSRVRQVLDGAEGIIPHARHLSRYDNAFFIGRGLNYPVAMEGALKLKEISYIHAEAYAAGELKHGPFALLGPSTPVVAMATRDDTYEPMLTSIKEIKARGSQVIALAEEGDEDIEQFVDAVIRIPPIDPLFSPFLNSVALQLLAYYAAKERGCPIDLPANLAKSVTVP